MAHQYSNGPHAGYIVITNDMQPDMFSLQLTIGTNLLSCIKSLHDVYGIINVLGGERGNRNYCTLHRLLFQPLQ